MFKKALLGVAALLLTATATLGGELTTASFVLPQTTLSATGGRVSTATYHVDTCVAQESVVGLAATASYVLESGFLTSQSTNPVPVELLRFEIVDLPLPMPDDEPSSAAAATTTDTTTEGETS